MNQNFFEYLNALGVCIICIAGAIIGMVTLVTGALLTVPFTAVLLIATFIYGPDPLPPSKAAT